MPPPDPRVPPAAVPTADRQAAGPGAERLEELIDAVRRYRTAEIAMRGRSRDSMHLGRSDMTALRLLLRAGQAGTPLTAAALARELGISTAATTVLVDRLAKSGHAERRPSATDRRAVEIWPTVATDEEVRATMGTLHERMMAAVNALSPAESAVIHRFLGDLGRAVSGLRFPVEPGAAASQDAVPPGSE
ncbi:MarR family transcriptional regulator [Arthrobacter sp. Soc17.1.1.1]|uniref:MarR family winged helix-turn-helix transcriptional regulator n=1 Tax=Arthrobacter sp. Soc17.1.1.1 TaxID=3121277 RepID=UPI002FE46582